jgi:hypothetical protein
VKAKYDTLQEDDGTSGGQLLGNRCGGARYQLKSLKHSSKAASLRIAAGAVRKTFAARGGPAGTAPAVSTMVRTGLPGILPVWPSPSHLQNIQWIFCKPRTALQIRFCWGMNWRVIVQARIVS